MFQGPTNRKQFVVTCKLCRRDVPSGVKEFPFQSVVVECQLCGEKRRYLPSEVFLGKPDHLVAHLEPRRSTLMYDPDANLPRLNRSMVYLGACLIAGIRFAREKQVNMRVVTRLN